MVDTFSKDFSKDEILLEKLREEIGNIQDINEEYTENADSETQLWIAKVEVLLTETGNVTKFEIMDIPGKDWDITREKIRQLLLVSAEKLKLKLEIDGHPDSS